MYVGAKHLLANTVMHSHQIWQMLRPYNGIEIPIHSSWVGIEALVIGETFRIGSDNENIVLSISPDT